MGQFTGAIDLQVIPGNPDNWLVSKPFSYTTDDGTIIPIPAGLKTDLASTPRIIWNIYPPFGLYTGAAIVHDDLYTTGRFVRSRCDEILLEAMQTEGVSWFTRHLIYRMVRLFGWAAWDQHRKEDSQNACV